MKRYLLFAGDNYYPKGGGEDFIAAFDTIEAALLTHDPKKFEYDGGWANIFDVEDLKIVKYFDCEKWTDGEPEY